MNKPLYIGLSVVICFALWNCHSNGFHYSPIYINYEKSIDNLQNKDTCSFLDLYFKNRNIEKVKNYEIWIKSDSCFEEIRFTPNFKGKYSNCINKLKEKNIVNYFGKTNAIKINNDSSFGYYYGIQIRKEKKANNNNCNQLMFIFSKDSSVIYISTGLGGEI